MAEKPTKVIADKCIGFPISPTSSEIRPRDAILYALGMYKIYSKGITYSQDPLNKDDLKFTFELHPDFQVFPTYGN